MSKKLKIKAAILAAFVALSVIVMGFIVLGSVLRVDLVWELADMFNGLMVLPNLIALIGLSKIVSMALRDYDANNPR